VPFRKRDAESIRNISELKASDKEGMIFQPEPGVYEKVHQIDFTSLYPSIIVKYNLSPETLEHPERSGFLSTVLSSLLNLRIETKRLKKTNKEYAGIDSILKWMLVTCFGYTGYRNAKFGQIQIHERITDTSRELLLQIKELAEKMGFEVLHGIVDCLWVIGEPISAFKESVEKDTGILTEVDSYDWITFLPMSDGTGAYNSSVFTGNNAARFKDRRVQNRFYSR
jgi:DNA polymerase I